MKQKEEDANNIFKIADISNATIVKYYKIPNANISVYKQIW